MLRQESGAALHDFDLVESIGLDGHARTDRVAVAGGPAQAHGERRRLRLEIVSEDPKLRRLPIGHHDEVRIAIAVDVEDRKRPAVLIEVEADRPGDLVVAAMAIVAQEHVALPAGDRAVNQQLIDRAPRIVVGCARHSRER